MKITTHTHSDKALKLTLRTGLVHLLGGLLFILISFATLFLLGRSTHIAIEDNVILYKSSLLGRLATQEWSEQASNIELINLTEQKNFGVSYQITITTRNQQTRIATLLSDGDTKRDLVDSLIANINEPESQFSHHESGTMTAIAIAIPCLTGGLTILVFAQTTTISSDSETRLWIISRRPLFPFLWRTTALSVDEFLHLNEKAFTVGEATSYFLFASQKDHPSSSLAFGPMFTTKNVNELKSTLTPWLNRLKRN